MGLELGWPTGITSDLWKLYCRTLVEVVSLLSVLMVCFITLGQDTIFLKVNGQC